MQKRCVWNDSPEFAKLHELMDQALSQTGNEQQKTWNQCFDLISENVPLYPVLQVQTTTGSWRDTANGDGTKVSSDFKGIGTTGISLIGVSTTK